MKLDFLETLDHVDGIVLETARLSIKNWQQMWSLRQGIFHLARNVRSRELEYAGSSIVMAIGVDDSALLGSFFNWFAISTTNYARLVGFVELFTREGWVSRHLEDRRNQKKIKEHCDQYAEKVIPQVLLWRHKISAHLAITAPRGENLATLEASLHNTMVYDGKLLKAGAMTWGSGGRESELPAWSLPREFERLTPGCAHGP